MSLVGVTREDKKHESYEDCQNYELLGKILGEGIGQAGHAGYFGFWVAARSRMLRNR